MKCHERISIAEAYVDRLETPLIGITAKAAMSAVSQVDLDSGQDRLALFGAAS
jgi:hypothetical protein